MTDEEFVVEPYVFKNKLKHDEWNSFFATDGWQEFFRYLKECVDDANIELRHQIGEELYRAQGVAQCLDKIIQFRETVTPTAEKEI